MLINYVPLSWNELISFNIKLEDKKKSIIIVELDDDLNRKYNAIVIKYDNKKNVHVRYLDNPFYENKYWWTSNKNNIPGLNPLSYNAICLGDKCDEMEGLTKEDFQEDGYDDIINYEKESYRFFKSITQYPYLDGIQGNVHVNNYYVSEYNKILIENGIPNCIKRKIGKENIKRISNKSKNIDDIVLENIVNKKKIIEYKKLLGMKMTYEFIRNYNQKIGLTAEEMLDIRENLREGISNVNLIRIIPYLIKCNIKLFDCDKNELNILEYIDKIENEWIYLLKYMGKIDTIIFV